jgi:L-ascorbate metabolism protein UlaG (beta-lactamase superfamily)
LRSSRRAAPPVLSESLPGFVPRNAPPGVPIDRLPWLEAILVSHNHDDHLELPTLEQHPPTE